MIFDVDDLGVNHVISDICQSHDCRDALIKLHDINPKFKATLFAIPEYMNVDLLNWVEDNKWVEIAVHGFAHSSNYECEKMSYQEFDGLMNKYNPEWWGFLSGFKAPGWQISDDIYQWLLDNAWWVADQEYNDSRRPKGLRIYKVGENSLHRHAWDCVSNGMYETAIVNEELVRNNDDWKFVSEVVCQSS